MASTFKFTTTFQGSSMLPEDRFVNTWHFMNTAGMSPSDFDNVRDMLRDFWIASGTGQALKSYLTSTTVTPTVTVKAYDYADSPPRVPKYESTFSLGSLVSAPGLPTEVALCLSYQASKASGVPQARRRNRVYLGPFTTAVSDNYGRPTAPLVTNMLRAIKDLRDAAQASVAWDWVVYSPTNSDQYVAHDAWVDNAWDTQRRRGLPPTTRSVVVF